MCGDLPIDAVPLTGLTRNNDMPSLPKFYVDGSVNVYVVEMRMRWMRPATAIGG